MQGDYLYDIVPTFVSTFNSTEQRAILEALEWAISTTNLDFEGVLPTLPHSDDFKREHLRITKNRILKVLQPASDDPIDY